MTRRTGRRDVPAGRIEWVAPATSRRGRGLLGRWRPCGAARRDGGHCDCEKQGRGRVLHWREVGIEPRSRRGQHLFGLYCTGTDAWVPSGAAKAGLSEAFATGAPAPAARLGDVRRLYDDVVAGRVGGLTSQLRSVTPRFLRSFEPARHCRSAPCRRPSRSTRPGHAFEGRPPLLTFVQTASSRRA